MSKKLRIVGLLWPILLSSSLGGAQVNPARIEDALDTVKKAGQPAAYCPSCSIFSGETSPTVRNCVEALCEDPKFSMSVEYENAYEAYLDRTPYDSELAPLVREIRVNDANELLAESRLLLEWIKDKKTLTDTAAVRMFRLNLGIKDYGKIEFKSEDGAMKVDEAASRANLKDEKISKEELQRRGFVVKKLRELAEQVFTEVPDNPEAFALLYPKDKVQQKIAEWEKRILELENKVKQHPETAFLVNSNQYRDALDSKMLIDELKSGVITSGLLNDLGGAFIFLKGLELAIDDPDFRRNTSHPVDLSYFAARTVQRAERNIQLAQERLRPDFEISDEVCGGTWQLGQVLLPTSAQNKEMAKKIPGFRDKFKSGLKRFLSVETWEKKSKLIDRWNAEMPQTKTAHFQHMKEMLKRAAAYSRWEKRFNDIKNGPDRDRILPLFLLDDDDDEDPHMNRSPEYDCEDLFPNIYSDAAYRAHGGFLVGPAVVRFGEKVEGIVFHELAHLLAKELQEKDVSPATKSWFEKSRQCLAAQHTEVDGEKREFYQDEDWADLMAANLLPESRFACSFLVQSAQRAGRYELMSLINPDPTDDHSSDLFRVMHHHVVATQKLPDVCVRALEKKGQKVNFKNCALAAQE